MAVIDQYQPADRTAVDALYRRVFGNDAADAHRFRWDWQYRRNPCIPATGPPIWVAREGPAVVGHYGTIPARLQAHGAEIDASWGAELMVAPERRRESIAEKLFSAWDATVGASLGLGPEEASSRLCPPAASPRPWPKPFRRQAAQTFPPSPELVPGVPPEVSPGAEQQPSAARAAA